MERILRLVAIVAVAAAAGCASAGHACTKTSDCASGLRCECRGMGVNPCTPDMSREACAEASCGGRHCVDPNHPPPPPP